MNRNRPLVQQQFSTFVVALAAANVAQPIDPNGSLSQLIDSFVVCVDAAAANSVFLGDANVTVNSGIEIVAGNSVLFKIEQIRQLYELEYSLDAITEKAICETIQTHQIPFVCWNLSQVFLVAAAATNVRIMPTPNPYIQ